MASLTGNRPVDSKPAAADNEGRKKRLRLTDDAAADNTDIASPSTPAPDSHIDHAAALAYWSSTEATVNGVLGGYPHVSRIDLQGSSNFLAKLRRRSARFPPGRRLRRVVDCGAGIGRITDGFLARVADTVDLVEPVRAFTDQVRAANLGAVLNLGLEAWHPDPAPAAAYDLIWNQWCVGQLTDAQLVQYLRRLPAVLADGGWIVVKENLSNDYLGEDVYDETDSSVTRTDAKFRQLFEQAGLNVVATELQRGMPQVSLSGMQGTSPPEMASCLLSVLRAGPLPRASLRSAAFMTQVRGWHAPSIAVSSPVSTDRDPPQKYG